MTSTAGPNARRWPKDWGATSVSIRQISAVIGINDEAALEAVRTVQASGRGVPEDISVVGFDDIATAAMSSPALTTMQVDKRGMGQNAVELLIWRLRNPTLAPMTLMMHARLVERESIRSQRAPEELVPLEL